ncbi:hypothetical protein, partial [Acetobacter estunensis]
KTQKLPAKHINQGFFDPSIYKGSFPCPKGHMPILRREAAVQSFLGRRHQGKGTFCISLS